MVRFTAKITKYKMIFQAYNETAVRNLQLQETAEELLKDGRLTPPQYEQVKTAFPMELKQGNLFVRIGLFLFTGLCVAFSILLVTWLTGNFGNSQKGWGAQMLFFGITLTALNEYFIRDRHWYRQGSDNALCYASLICLSFGLSVIFDISNELIYAVIALVLLTLATVRYGDPFLAFGAFYALIYSFLIAFEDNNLPLIALPFVCAALSLMVYFFAKNAMKRPQGFYWEDCFKVLEIAGLVGFYSFINYYVVENLIHNNPETSIFTPYNALFTFLTAAVPLAYLTIGIRNKDRILWILGSLGIVASVLTYRYYHAIMPIEWALTGAGIAFLAVAVFLMRYLKTPRKGFAYQPERNKNNVLEALIVNQFLPQTSNTSDETFKYGGGDFGGGGASSEY